MGAKKGNKNAEGSNGPSKYKPEYDDLAYKYCLLGATDAELASFLGVCEKTVNNWKIEYDSFLQSVTRGKDLADANVAEAFYKRALGYEYNEVTFEKLDDKVNLSITPDALITTDTYKKKIVTKHLPPDAGAALNWLKNRQKDKWRDKQDIEHSGSLDFGTFLMKAGQSE